MVTSPAAAAPGAQAVSKPPHDRAARGRRRATEWTIAVPAIVLAVVLLYLQPVFDLGFYYDDWSLLAAMDDAPGGGWDDRFAACREIDPAGRVGGCAYHATVNVILGEHAWAYHVLSMALLTICTLLLYALLRRCHLGRWPSLLACVLFVIYPGSDSTRLWPTALVAQYVLAAYIGAVLLGIEGVRRRGIRALAYHAGSLGLFVVLLFTYEVVVPPIAVAGMFYLVSVSQSHRRAAIVRGAIDLALALAFVVFRLFIAPVEASTGFVEDRTIEQWIDRVRAVLNGAWDSWQPLFVPGTTGMIVAAVAAVIWITAIAKDQGVRRDSVRWLAAAAGAVVFALVSVAAYLVANDLYVPDTKSLFNRLNLAAAPAYCVLFVSLCGLLWTALARWLPNAAATVIVALLALGVGVGQVEQERTSQQAWAASWAAQKAALAQVRALAPRLDRQAFVMSFGHPLYERNFIPVFADSWDLRGAIDVETEVDPSAALPFMQGTQCGATHVLRGPTPYVPYRGVAPLWFVNLASGQARQISSRRQCEAAVAEWGHPPFWGKSFTG